MGVLGPNAKDMEGSVSGGLSRLNVQDVVNQNSQKMEEFNILDVIGRNKVFQERGSSIMQQDMFLLVQKSSGQILDVTARRTCSEFLVKDDVHVKVFTNFETGDIDHLELSSIGSLNDRPAEALRTSIKTFNDSLKSD
ncbi:hypothetical protein HOH45_01150 [bacterium]|jgi:hypothetical protein|nr:hypothetical protein [bacterium]